MFNPAPNEEIVINGTSYTFGEHPVAPGLVYGQEGRQAVIYQIIPRASINSDIQTKALKVFKVRFKDPSLTALISKMDSFADLPGLSVCERNIITRSNNEHLLAENPDLDYSIVMPWLEGPTWIEILLDKKSLTQKQSLILARSLAEELTQMEQRGIAHCDLSGSNLILPGMVSPADNLSCVDAGQMVGLVDIEQMYAPDLEKPVSLPAGSPGYGHVTASIGMWNRMADRFAGAVLIAEILGWCDEQIRQISWGESYFDPGEIQKNCTRFNKLINVLDKSWGPDVTSLFKRAWESEALIECPDFSEWCAKLQSISEPYSGINNSGSAENRANDYSSGQIVQPASPSNECISSTVTNDEFPYSNDHILDIAKLIARQFTSRGETQIAAAIISEARIMVGLDSVIPAKKPSPIPVKNDNPRNSAVISATPHADSPGHESSYPKTSGHQMNFSWKSISDATLPEVDWSFGLGRIKQIKDLIEEGKDINIKDSEGRTALMWAAYRGIPDIVDKLIAAGADIDLDDIRGKTALIHAATAGKGDTAELLLNAGARVNKVCTLGRSALMWAAFESKTEVIKLLVARGGSHALVDTQGNCALSIAKKRGNKQVVAILSKLSDREGQ